MHEDLKEIQEIIDKIPNQNSEVLDEFTQWLTDKSLKEDTIEKHLGNISYYGNKFLSEYKLETLAEGIDSIDEFMSLYIPENISWADNTMVKEYTTSFKKFYQFMTETERVSDEDFIEMKKIIKYEKEFWLILVE